MMTEKSAHLVYCTGRELDNSKDESFEPIYGWPFAVNNKVNVNFEFETLGCLWFNGKYYIDSGYGENSLLVFEKQKAEYS